MICILVITTQTIEFTVEDNQPDPLQTLMTITTPIQASDERFHKGYTMVMTVFGSANVTVTFRPMGTNTFTFAAPPYRWVTLLVYPASHGGHGSPSSAIFFTKKSGIYRIFNHLFMVRTGLTMKNKT